MLLNKPTQHATAKVYTFVPVQDLNQSWDDEKLYKKYGLDSSEMDSYLIQYSTDLLSWKNGPEVDTRKQTQVSGLKSGVSYRFRVVSKKDSGGFIKISRESAQMKPS